MSAEEAKLAGAPSESGARSPPPSERSLTDAEAEVAQLREQVKDLVRTEAKLHRTQNELDHQLNLFRKLHELGVRLSGTLNLKEIATQAITFALYELGYERAVILLDYPATSGGFRPFAWDGFYGDGWADRFLWLEISAADPVCTLARAHSRLVSTEEAPVSQIGGLAAQLALGELLVVPLMRSAEEMLGLVVAGNSPDQKGQYVSVTSEHSAYGLANLAAQVAAIIDGALSHSALAEERNLLEHKVTERTRELADTMNAKSEFFANVSHELRTPLTLSIAPLEEVLQRGADLDAETKERHLKVMYSNQLRLLKLINNLLEFAKVDAGKVSARYQELNILQALRFYAGTLASAAEGRGITLAVESAEREVRLFVDRDKFEKIAMNLLSNAFKFTPDGGTIKVIVRIVGELVEVDVSDTGIGIPPESLPKLFQRFMQVDTSTKRKYEGTGIGLAMVKEYVAVHGGAVTVQSEAGKGTTFRLTFPMGQEHLPPDSIVTAPMEEVEGIATYELADLRTETDVDSDETAANMDGFVVEEAMVGAERLPAGAISSIAAEAVAQTATVLVVDDISDMRRFIAQILGEKYRVKTARDGREGLEAARRLRPDVIVSDVMMPNMTGYELCQAIKKDPGALSRTPVILLSAKGDLAHKLEGLEHGADDYLVKPFNADELLSRVRNLIRLRLQEKELSQTQLRLVEAERRALESEISIARSVQASILPKKSDLTLDDLELSGFLLSASACSGDFWYYRQIGDDRVLVALGDVTGHGVGSAMLTELAYGALNAIARARVDVTPSYFMNELNSMLVGESSPLWMSMVIGLLEPRKGRATWSNAGHPPVLCARGGDSAHLLSQTGPPVGANAEHAFTDLVVPMTPGMRFLIYSDGLLEAVNDLGRQFGLKRLAATFSGAAASARPTLDEIRRSLELFAGERSFDDDVTVISISRAPT